MILILINHDVVVKTCHGTRPKQCKYKKKKTGIDILCLIFKAWVTNGIENKGLMHSLHSYIICDCILILVTTGRHAFIGLGFADRGDSFDFNVALQDHFKWVALETQFLHVYFYDLFLPRYLNKRHHCTWLKFLFRTITIMLYILTLDLLKGNVCLDFCCWTCRRNGLPMLTTI